MLPHVHTLSTLPGADYEELTTLLTFNSMVVINVVTITIINDGAAEDVENLSAVLSFHQLPPPAVILKPNSTVVEIHDNDGMLIIIMLSLIILFFLTEVYIGFTSPQFVKNEGDGLINLEIGVISGLLQKEVIFNLFIYELTALGK